jgi:hypothetical protein
MIVLRGLLLAVSVAGALPAIAQTTDELAALKQEQARLRQSLDDIDRRIQILEGASPAAARPVREGKSQSFTTLQQAWSEIRPGVMKARVDEALGKPAREMRINSDLVWYYVYPGVGNGSVFFNSEEKVTAAQPPRSGWSW